MNSVAIDQKTRIYYQRIAGNHQNPTLIFLHHGLGSVGTWKNFPALLCQKSQCPGIVYDRAGHGNSTQITKERDVHYLRDHAIRELPALVEQLIPSEDFILVGHSDGGSISLIFGAEQDRRLKGIITESAHVFVEPETRNAIEVASKSRRKMLLMSLLRYHGEKTEHLFDCWSDMWLSAAFAGWSIEELLPAIRCPVLAIQGRNDLFGTDNQLIAIARRCRTKVDTLLIDDCGHSPHEEKQPEVLLAMSRFVARLKKATAY